MRCTVSTCTMRYVAYLFTILFTSCTTDRNMYFCKKVVGFVDPESIARFPAEFYSFFNAFSSFFHFFPFFPLFPPFFNLFKVSGHVEVGSSSKEPAFDLFARVGRRGLRDRVFLGPERGPPLYVAKKSWLTQGVVLGNPSKFGGSQFWSLGPAFEGDFNLK